MPPKGWIMLTQKGQPGNQIAVQASQIVSVRPGDDDIPGSASIVDLVNGKVQGLKEDMNTVLQRISDNI